MGTKPGTRQNPSNRRRLERSDTVNSAVRIHIPGTALACYPSPKSYCFLTLGSLSAPCLVWLSSSVIAWGNMKPRLKNITATRAQWPTLVRVEPVVAGVASLHCAVRFIVVSCLFDSLIKAVRGPMPYLAFSSNLPLLYLPPSVRHPSDESKHSSEQNQ